MSGLIVTIDEKYVCECGNYELEHCIKGEITFIEKSAYDELKAKCEKLKSLILLTDPVVSNEEISRIAVKQWNEFIRVFPEERWILRERMRSE